MQLLHLVDVPQRGLVGLGGGGAYSVVLLLEISIV